MVLTIVQRCFTGYTTLQLLPLTPNSSKVSSIHDHRSFLFSKALNLGRPAQSWNPPSSLEDRLQRGCKTWSFWNHFWPLAIWHSWVLGPNTWLCSFTVRFQDRNTSPATAVTVSYLEWPYNILQPPIATLAPPCGTCKNNAVFISSPFIGSKMNLPVL